MISASHTGRSPTVLWRNDAIVQLQSCAKGSRHHDPRRAPQGQSMLYLARRPPRPSAHLCRARQSTAPPGWHVDAAIGMQRAPPTDANRRREPCALPEGGRSDWPTLQQAHWPTFGEPANGLAAYLCSDWTGDVAANGSWPAAECHSSRWRIPSAQPP